MFIPGQLRIHLSAKEIAMSKGHWSRWDLQRSRQTAVLVWRGLSPHWPASSYQQGQNRQSDMSVGLLRVGNSGCMRLKQKGDNRK